MRDHRASGTATVISRLRAAGTVEIGRLNMAEFAMGPTGHNEHWGDTRNPWNPLHITGGSSSGSAGAVAAGIVPFALGSDTGGSIRVPAACCGITGLKPTYARVSRFGALHLASSLDVIGPLARSAADIAWVMDRIDGPDPLDPTCWAPPTRFADRLGGDVRAVRIGVPENYYWEALDAEIAEACRAALAAFPNVVNVKVPDLAAINVDCLSISGFESGARHREGFEAHPEAYGVQVRTRLLRGLEVPEEEYEAVRARRPQMVRDFVDQAFRDADMLAVPVLRRPVPTLAETDVGGGAGIAGILADLSYATRGFSALGLPNIVFPVGFAGGLPVGLMLAGRPYADADLVAVADFYQQATGWHRSP
jgi:aspartyl-tRNA(Asn)/glutamyl-tRNA(Gln) amidotransferase subunit A